MNVPAKTVRYAEYHHKIGERCTISHQFEFYDGLDWVLVDLPTCRWRQNTWVNATKTDLEVAVEVEEVEHLAWDASHRDLELADSAAELAVDSVEAESVVLDCLCSFFISGK